MTRHQEFIATYFDREFLLAVMTRDEEDSEEDNEQDEIEDIDQRIINMIKAL